MSISPSPSLDRSHDNTPTNAHTFGTCAQVYGTRNGEPVAAKVLRTSYWESVAKSMEVRTEGEKEARHLDTG